MPKIEIPDSLYVGCSLTGAPEDFVAEVEATKDILKKNYDVYDFVGLTAGTEKDVYDYDIGNCVANCGMFVGVCDIPSIGLGRELCKAIELGKPTLGIAEQNARVTRLVLGAAVVEPNFSFERYDNMRIDTPKLVAAKFAIARASL